MRVIGGAARGRRLVSLAKPGLRPTSDRAREAIFDVLSHLGALEEADVLDLFAGTGALGIEAVSRGAASATFVEHDRQAAALIAANLERTGLAGAARTTVVCRDALAYLSGRPAGAPAFTVGFADPPYAFAEWPRLLSGFPADLAVLESSRPLELPEGLILHRVYRYGGTLVTVAMREAGR